jgi:hypothetical protein
MPASFRDWEPLAWLASVPTTTWAIVGLSLLFLAGLEGSYRLVAGEYDLAAEITHVMTGDQGGQTGAIGVILFVTIRNMGAPTTLDTWQLDVTLPNGRRIAGVIGFGWPDLHLDTGTPQAAGKTMRLTREHDLMEQTLKNPIPTGSRVVGATPFLVRGVAKELVMQAGTKIRLRFRDIRGNDYVAEQRMTGSRSGAVPYVPGMGSLHP